MGSCERETPGRGTGPSEPKRGGNHLTRRALLRRLGVATAAVGLSYARPSLLTVGVPKLYANSVYGTPTPTPTPTPPPPDCGLTPGYWKNWRNQYTEAQFLGLLNRTFVASVPGVASATGMVQTADAIVEIADDIFDDYQAKPGEEMTILRAFLLAVQLTIALVAPGLPDPPPGVNLSRSSVLPSGGTLGDAIDDALALEATYPYSTPGVSSADRDFALDTKDRLAELLTL